MSEFRDNQPDTPVTTDRHRKLAVEHVATAFERTFPHVQRWVKEGGVTHLMHLKRAADAVAIADAEGYARCNELLQQAHAAVAEVCERLGDKPEEVPCDIWRVWEHIERLQVEAQDLRAKLAAASPQWKQP